MSKGDENLDQLVKDAFGAEQHEFNPAYWQEAQQMLKANQVAKTAFYAKPIFILGSAILLIASIGLYSDSTDFNDSNISEIAFLATNIDSHNNENSTQITAIEDADVTQNKTKEILDFEKKNHESVNESPFKGMTTSSKEEMVKSSKQITEPITIAKIQSNKGGEIESSSQESSGTSEQKSKLKIAEENTPAIAKSVVTAALVQNGVGDKSTTTASTVYRKAGSKTMDEVELKTGAYTNSSSRVNAKTVQLAEMETRGLNGIDYLTENSAFIGASDKKNKKINKPINLRVSASNLWVQPLNTESALIQNKCNQNALEISLEYMLQKHWGVQVGASWSQNNVEQEYRYVNTIDNSYWEENQVITEVDNKVWWLGGWYNYPNTYDTTLSHELINVTDTVSGNKQINHRIQMIEIPVLITYNYGLNRFNIQLSTGVSFGAIINAKGNYFASEDPFVVPVSSSGFNSVQTSFLLRSELAYGLNDHWWISVQPQLKLNLNSVYPNEATVAPKSTYYGVSLGIIYKF